MEKTKIAIFLVLSFILLTANTEAYQGCNGEYTPYPVKCVGGGGSAYSGNQVDNTPTTTTSTSETQSSNNNPLSMSSLSWNYNLLETVWIIAGLLAIAYFVKRLFFRRHHHRHHKK